MILVTGATGFIGSLLTRQLIDAGHTVRVMLRPSVQSPNLPLGLPVDVALASLQDERGLRAAMIGVETVYHLASDEWRGAQGSLRETDILGTQAVARAALDAGVRRLIYTSHLGADRASAYPLMKAKAIAEETIRRSGLEYTILRAAVAFGPGDGFTTGLAWLARMSPFVFWLPGDGKTLLQPIWVDDLVAALAWSLDLPDTVNQTFEIGGGEYLSIEQITRITLETLGVRKAVFTASIPYLRWLTVLLEGLFPAVPISSYWLDYLSTNRTCALDTLPRYFHLMPARFTPEQLSYLLRVDWARYVWQTLWAGFRWRRRRQAGRRV